MLSQSGGNPIDGAAALVMSMVYPQLKGIMEASTRRIVVNVTWKEGVNKRSLNVMQWITNPQQAGVIGDVPEGEESVANPASGSGSPGSTRGGRPPSGGLPGAKLPGGSR